MSNSVISFRLRVTEESVRREFSQFGEVVDVRGAGLFEVFIDFFQTLKSDQIEYVQARNTEVYVRFREKSSAQHALTSLNGR